MGRDTTMVAVAMAMVVAMVMVGEVKVWEDEDVVMVTVMVMVVEQVVCRPPSRDWAQLIRYPGGKFPIYSGMRCNCQSPRRKSGSEGRRCMPPRLSSHNLASTPPLHIAQI